MKSASSIAILSVIMPLTAFGYDYTITDEYIRNRSYSVEEITQSVYNMSLGLGWVVEREFYAPVFHTNEDGETKYYKWIAPDLTKYKTSTNEDIFSLTDHGNGSIYFSVVDNSVFNIDEGNVSLQKYYYINSPSNNRIRSDNETINSLSQDFIGNSVGGNGGAIYNTVTINSIAGNFIKNHASENGNGGAIYNAGTIQTITGDFIENRSSLRYGGAIYNSGTINSIIGDFVHNTANYSGGVVYNNGTIDSITGTFVENGASDGGVVHNYVNSPINTITTINSINGNFIHNHASGLGGVIYNDGGYGAINSITSDFIYNSAEYGGAIFNRNTYTINSITGNFIGNSASERGGAVYNAGGLTFTNNVLFSCNTASYGGAIFNNSGRITMNIDEDSSVRFETASDSIYNYNNGFITINGTTTGTPGHIYLQSIYNAKIGTENISTRNTVNLNNIYAYLADGQTINQSNLNIDKYSILYAPVDSLNVDNINNRGVISLTSGTLTQNLSHYGYGGNVEVSGSVFADTTQLDIPTINNGTLNFDGGNLTQDISGTGNIVNTGSLFANADKIGQSLINNGTLTLTGGTFEQDITGTGNIIIDGNVTANNLFVQSMTINPGRNLVSSANNIVTESLTNNGTLTLTEGTLSQDITGTGNIVISGNVVSNVNMTQDTTINSGKSLTVSVDNIKNTNLTNNGMLWFNGGTLDKALSNYGNVGNKGILNANPVNIDQNFVNNGMLTVSSGTINHSINTDIVAGDFVAENSYGHMIIDGDVIANTLIAQDFITINDNKSLTISADNIRTDGFDNNGVLKLTGGTLDIFVPKYGYETQPVDIPYDYDFEADPYNIVTGVVNYNGEIVIDGDVISNEYIVQNTTINNGKSLTIFADGIKSDILTNNGLLKLSGGTLSENISNYGNTEIIGSIVANANNIDTTIVNHGVLNISGGVLRNDIIGGNTVINNGATIESIHVFDIEMNGVWNVGSNTVYASNANINGIVNMNIDGISKDSDLYIGGKLIADSITLGNDSELRLVVTANDLEKGESTGNIKVVDANFWNGNWQNISQNNAKYSIDIDELNHTIKLTYTRTNEDIMTGGNEDPNSGNNETPENQGSGNGGNSENPNSGNNENPGNTNTGNNETPENQGSENGGNSENPNSGNNENPGNTNTGNNETPENQGSENGGNSERTNRVNNMINVANAWEQETASNNPVVQQIANMLNYNSQYNVPEYLRMLRSIAPNDSAVIPGTSRMINAAIYNLVSNRLSAVGHSGGDVMTDVSVWGQGLQNHSSQSGDTGFTGNTSGFSLGADKKITEDAIIGLGYAYSDTSATAGDRNINADGHTLFVYAEYRNHKTSVDEEGNTISKTVSPLYFDAVLSYGMSNYEDKAGYGISSEYSTNTLGLNGNVGYYLTDNLDVFVGGRYLKIYQDDYTDSIGQKISVKDDDVFTARFGGRYTGNGSIFIPTAHLELTYDVKSNDRLAVVNTENSSYQITGDAINPFGVQAGLGIISNIDNWKLSLNYDLEWHPEFISHTGRIRAKYAF